MSSPEAVRLPLLPWPAADAPAGADGNGGVPSPRRALGVLEVRRGAAEERAPLPLQAVEVAACVAEGIAEVTLAETFHNPYAETLEAVYVFPLPGGAAVFDFELRVGSRVLRGEVRERGAARREYRDALARGKRAALLEQERDDVFTVQVGNLPPGEEVAVRLTYAERLPFFEDGATELRLPLVVAPRYVPGEELEGPAAGGGVEPDTTLVPDASRISPPRLVPGFDPRVALSLEVELLRGDGGELATLACSQHATRTETTADRVTVALSRQDEPLDRDFVLRWRRGGERLRTTLLVHRGEGGEAGYGLLSVVPPAREGFLGLARDVVFVLDRSGSMEGVKMVSAARACSLLLGSLGPRDRFAILAFDDQVEWMPLPEGGGRFTAASEGAVERGHGYLRQVESRGGTELDAAVGEALLALRALGGTAGRAPVVVVLTDGQIGDEHRVLRRLQTELGEARVFTVGIDTAVNAAFLARLAALGGGTAAFVEPGAALEEALLAIAREVGAPLVVDLAVEDVDAGLEATSLAPARLPDLFAGRAAAVSMRLARAGRLRLRGRGADGGGLDEEVAGREVALPALAHLWARSRVRDLEDRYRVATEPGRRSVIERQIVELAVRHRLLTRFTAFVVVDESETVVAGDSRTVVQPVAMPQGWAAGSALGGAPKAAGFAAFEEMEGPAMYDLAEPELDLDDTAVGMAPPSLPARAPAPSQAFRPAAFTAPPPPEEPEIDLLGELGEEPAPAEQAPAVGEALQALAEAIEEARRELAAGRVPPPAPLVAARTRLLAALAAWRGSVDVPALQRFLRVALAEAIAACGASGATAGSLMPLLTSRFDAFAAAHQEAIVALSSTEGPRWGLTL